MAPVMQVKNKDQYLIHVSSFYPNMATSIAAPFYFPVMFMQSKVKAIMAANQVRE